MRTLITEFIKSLNHAVHNLPKETSTKISSKKFQFQLVPKRLIFRRFDYTDLSKKKLNLRD